MKLLSLHSMWQCEVLFLFLQHNFSLTIMSKEISKGSRLDWSSAVVLGSLLEFWSIILILWSTPIPYYSEAKRKALQLKIWYRVSLFQPLAPVHQTGGFAKMHLLALREVAKMKSASFPKWAVILCNITSLVFSLMWGKVFDLLQKTFLPGWWQTFASNQRQMTK